MDLHEDYARIPYLRRCVVLRNGRPLESMTCNLSVLGLYLTFPGQIIETIPEVHETIELSFLLPGDEAVQCEASVTWKNLDAPRQAYSLPPGCGVRFATMPPSARQRIKEVVREYRRSEHDQSEIPAPYVELLRIPYVQPCLIVGETGTWRGVVCNLSQFGAYVAADPIPGEGEPARLLFWLPKQTQPVDVTSEVVWVNPEEPRRTDSLPAGCGLRFLNMPAPLRERLDALITKYLSMPGTSQ